ncbi:glycoside hydrolase family 32 protein [Dorea sp. AM13-35]|uniref:glycoside hydrolase family 32 protein n=1 Tax=Dorea sp. AM13-35 TaxID=2293099 RepID=UPI000E53886A|nr:glycoside hydrolase family 32 protein [Dorea sp. AM13-35]RHO42403.1 glycosyl hydrolase family 32 [Dorea sp. AM13-35]
MNALTRDLIKLTDIAETQGAEKEEKLLFREHFHLMPPVGWLNDPNGLCQFEGVYHAFFQYSPFDAEGGVKMWGHYISDNMLDWKYQGVALYPDQPFDCHGVYSGSALVEDGKMYLYYTGNVKLEDGEYDYIRTGREGNTVLVSSEDGIHFGHKKQLMRNTDYPDDLTCHVRDPKVWKEQDTYYMVQGARTKEDVGQILIFTSKDKVNWKFKSRIESKEPFGYMWECPDYFTIGDKKILSASVQGLEGGIWEERNVYQSGYFEVEGDILSSYKLGEYKLWDYGFDYYAPQSFETEDGRRIHISWMGMPDCEAYTNLTIADGWQHCFTLPREIYVKDGKICQRPIRELDYKEAITKIAENKLQADSCKAYDLKIDKIQNNQFCIALAEELLLEYTDGRFRMRFTDNRKTCVSAGRDCRYVETDEVTNIRVIADVSSVEVFVNDGEYVFSTRYYPDKYNINVQAEGADICLAEIK